MVGYKKIQRCGYTQAPHTQNNTSSSFTIIIISSFSILPTCYHNHLTHPNNNIMKIAIYAALAGSAAAFTPSVSVGSSTSLRMETSPDEAASPFVPTVLPINGWVPNPKEPCFGLPGAISPLGFFDPLGFTKDKSVDGKSFDCF